MIEKFERATPYEQGEEQEDTYKDLSWITQVVGYRIADDMIPFMKDFARRYWGIEAARVERKHIVYPTGKFDELNICVEGTKEGKKAYLIGECRAKLGKKDVDRFTQVIKRAKDFLEGEVSCFMVTYTLDLPVENYLKENYPQLEVFKSYEIEINYQRI